MSEIIGIDYSNLPPLEGKGEPSQHPFVALRGVDLFAEKGSYADSKDGREPVEGQIQRLVLNVRPHHDIGGPNLLNLDTNQLYSPVNKESYTYGTNDMGNGGESEGIEGCPPDDLTGPVYSNPAPIAGRPVEFRRVYFRGNRVDPIKGYTIDKQPRTFSAVFACSNPIEQTQYDKNGDQCEPYQKNTLFNSRNENTQYDGKVWEWGDIEISPDSCPSFSVISGLKYDFFSNGSYYAQETGLVPQGGTSCSTLNITGSQGIAVDLRGNQVNIIYTGSGGGAGGNCGTKLSIFGESKEYFSNYGHSGFDGSFDPDSEAYTGIGSGSQNCVSNNISFVGTKGIRTFLSGYHSEIEGSGLCSGDACETRIEIRGCPSFNKISGLAYDDLSADIITATGDCGDNGLFITGSNGIRASVSNSDGSINISYTGCGNSAFTGISGMAGYAYKNTNSCDNIIFSGQNGLRSIVQNNTVIYDYTGLPNFATSGCLGKDYNSQTNTHTYYIDKSSILSCLGYFETGVNLLTWAGSLSKTNFTTSDFTNSNTVADIEISRAIILLSNDCPTDDQMVLSPGCIPVSPTSGPTEPPGTQEPTSTIPPEPTYTSSTSTTPFPT